MQYREWLDCWLENYIRPTAKAKTYERYRQIAQNQLIADMGGQELCALTPISLQSYVTGLLHSGNKRTGKGLAPSTVNTIITVIRASLGTAHELGYLETDVGRCLRRPRAEEKRITCFSVAEQRQLEEEILRRRCPKLYGILICLYTGLRLGELLALEWSDVDLVRCELSVSKTCFDGKDRGGVFGRITNAPKTPTSERLIPIPRSLIPLFCEMKHSATARQVIAEGGRPIAVRSYQRSFERLQARLAIPHRGFHALRHTFATRALEIGVDVKTLAEILGHKNASVTLARYAHSLPEHKREMMNRLGALL